MAYTYAYAQPDAYHFCQDSVLFPKFVAEQLRGVEIKRALDLCAGCGVIGFELNYHHPIERMDFMEVQEDFLPYFKENLRITGRDPAKYRWRAQNYARLLEESPAQYDLIIANPPYFMKGEGKAPPSLLNERCRFFVDSDLPTLARAVRHALTPNGRAFLLIKSGAVHGRDALAQVGGEVVGDIRGTAVVKLSHQAPA